jgi:hypothetical protein
MRDLRRQGYDVSMGKRGHWHVRKGGRLLAVTGSTPGDRNALKNLKGQLRRAETGR